MDVLVSDASVHCLAGDVSDDQAVIVAFSLCTAMTCWGESLRVTGDSAELGSWQPDAAVPMVTNPTCYPRWCSGRIRIATGGGCLEVHSGRVVVSYKYIRDSQAHGDGFRWEDGIVNRYVEIPLQRGVMWLVQDQAFDMEAPRHVTPVPLQKTGASTLLATGAEEDAYELLQFWLEPPLLLQHSFEETFVLDGEEPLGEGGFGMVWRCRPKTIIEDQAHLFPMYAVKRTSPTYTQETLTREAELHWRSRHPHVVQLVGVFEGSGILSLVMECCHGGDLWQLIRWSEERYARLGLSATAARHIAKQLLLALACLHGNRIAHGDVKCENMMMLECRTAVKPERATFKLGDFGLAQQLPTETEIIDADASLEFSDVYAAGALLYNVFAGERLDSAEGRRPWSRMAYVCSAATSFLDQLLQPSAKRRPSATEAMKHHWVELSPPRDSGQLVESWDAIHG